MNSAQRLAVEKMLGLDISKMQGSTGLPVARGAIFQWPKGHDAIHGRTSALV